MCLIITKPFGAQGFPLDIVRRSWYYNRNGAGVAYFRKGDTHATCIRGIMTEEEHLQILEQVNKPEYSLISHNLNHELDLYNKNDTYPYRTEDMAYFLNGKIHITADGNDEDRSKKFFQEFIAQHDFYNIQANLIHWNKSVGENKIALMNLHNGDILHLSNTPWHIYEEAPGCLFSNFVCSEESNKTQDTLILAEPEAFLDGVTEVVMPYSRHKAKFLATTSRLHYLNNQYKEAHKHANLIILDTPSQYPTNYFAGYLAHQNITNLHLIYDKKNELPKDYTSIELTKYLKTHPYKDVIFIGRKKNILFQTLGNRVKQFIAPINAETSYIIKD